MAKFSSFSEITNKRKMHPWEHEQGIDVRAELDLNVGAVGSYFLDGKMHYGRIPHDIRVKQLQSEASDLESFINDHRSRDRYYITIVTVGQIECQFCGDCDGDIDPEDGLPTCCDKAIEVATAAQAEASK